MDVLGRGSMERRFTGPLPDRIRHARSRAEVSQAALAERLGVVPSAVAQWEVPGGTSPTVTHLAQIAAITGVAFEWLATGRGATAMAADATPAVDRAAFARDMTEERLLLAFRRFSPKRREALARCIEELS
jgi:transcriptional regulator with XRE-family HTH domain